MYQHATSVSTLQKHISFPKHNILRSFSCFNKFLLLEKTLFFNCWEFKNQLPLINHNYCFKISFHPYVSILMLLWKNRIFKRYFITNANPKTTCYKKVKFNLFSSSGIKNPCKLKRCGYILMIHQMNMQRKTLICLKSWK